MRSFSQAVKSPSVLEAISECPPANKYVRAQWPCSRRNGCLSLITMTFCGERFNSLNDPCQTISNWSSRVPCWTAATRTRSPSFGYVASTTCRKGAASSKLRGNRPSFFSANSLNAAVAASEPDWTSSYVQHTLAPRQTIGCKSAGHRRVGRLCVFRQYDHKHYRSYDSADSH